MAPIAIIIHGGAGPDSKYIHENEEGYRQGLKDAVAAGYEVLEKGGSALDAVQAAVVLMEDNPLFNAGCGGALTMNEEVELCAGIMDGKELRCGAVAVVKEVRNPVVLARTVMEQSSYIYLGGKGALQFAKEKGLQLEPMDYFITDHQYEALEEAKKEDYQTSHGTVGAVALDKNGNLAAATSTGGTEAQHTGRIADSSMISVGTYANNETCAVSATGDGEYIIPQGAAHHIAALIEYKGLTLQAALDFLVHEKCKDIEGDMGLIAVDPKGNIAHTFNSERMHRGWQSNTQNLQVHIYKEDKSSA